MIRMLVATDGSPHAIRAAGLAARLAREVRKAEVVLVNVGYIPPVALAGPGGEVLAGLAALEEGLEQAGRTILEQMAQAFGGIEVSVTRVYRRGEPPSEILRAAEEAHADLIIVGSRGLGRIGGLILGSVSERVLHGAHCPVLVVR